MTPAGLARVRACFENMEEIFPVGDPRNREQDSQVSQSRYLPQMPQLPQQQASARRVLTDREDAFEERAAIIEYDGGLSKALAEFLAGRRCGPNGEANK